MQGFQRLRQLLFLGDYKSAHTLALSIFTDFQPNAGQSTTIPWLSAPPKGVYQFREFVTNQKCESLQFLLQESQSMPYGEGFQLSNVQMVVAQKKGAFKVPASESFG